MLIVVNIETTTEIQKKTFTHTHQEDTKQATKKSCFIKFLTGAMKIGAKVVGWMSIELATFVLHSREFSYH